MYITLNRVWNVILSSPKFKNKYRQKNEASHQIIIIIYSILSLN